MPAVMSHGLHHKDLSRFMLEATVETWWFNVASSSRVDSQSKGFLFFFITGWHNNYLNILDLYTIWCWSIFCQCYHAVTGPLAQPGMRTHRPLVTPCTVYFKAREKCETHLNARRSTQPPLAFLSRWALDKHTDVRSETHMSNHRKAHTRQYISLAHMRF